MANIKRNIAVTGAVCWTLLMCCLLFVPGQAYTGDLFFEGEDKIAHFTLFCVWSAFLFYLIKSKYFFRGVVIVLAAGLLFGVFTEFVQGYIPHRSRDLLDLGFDTAGTIMGIITGYFLKKELTTLEKKFNS